MSGVTLGNVFKSYGDTQVIHGLDLEINEGEFCVLVGPSGCGKSTLLRMVAGLEETTKGQVTIGERDVTRLEPAQRGVAMVFQSYALYPHMTVEENMGFGLRMNGAPKAEIEKKVAEANRILRLDPYLQRRPKELSGGQRQRVAIGRAIVRDPEVFLFDEPLSNLDAELRVEMRVEIARLHKEIGATMIYVTHDQVEAMTLADKIVVLRDGRIEQTGTPMELYRNPENRFVAGFIGSPSMNFFNASAHNGSISVPALKQDVPLEIGNKLDNASIEVGIRPEHLRVNQESDTFNVELIEQLGGVTYAYLVAETGENLIVEESGEIELKDTERVGVGFDTSNLMVFDKETGGRIRRINDAKKKLSTKWVDALAED